MVPAPSNPDPNLHRYRLILLITALGLLAKGLACLGGQDREDQVRQDVPQEDGKLGVQRREDHLVLPAGRGFQDVHSLMEGGGQGMRTESVQGVEGGWQER